MPVLFQSKVGQVVQLDDPAAQCTVSRPVLSFDNTVQPITWNTYRAIITRVTLSQQVNLQFLHALGSMVFVYVFGDRMGSVVLSGLSFFLCECDPVCGNPQPLIDQPDIYSWYKLNRASARQTPVKIGIGNAVLEGFVTSFNEDVVDPSINILQWTVQMMALPGGD